MLQCTRNKSAKKAVVAAAAASIVGGFLAKQIKRRFFSNHVAPTPTKEDFEYTVAGRALADEYNWMRDETRKSPRVLGHINRENRYCASTLDFKAADHSVVYKEMIGHIKEDNTNFPYRRTKYFYYTQDIKGKDYQVYMRVPVAADEPEQLYLDETQELDRQVLLDVNKLAAGFEYFNLGGLAISPCEEFLCYAFETDGSETYKLRTIEIATGRVVESIDVDSLTDDMCFGADSRTLFYVTMDEAHRPYRAFRHVVGGDCTHDELLVEEPDELYCLDVYKTQSSKFLVLRSAGPTESANWVMDLVASADGKSECKPHVRLVQERQEGVRYFLDHTRGQFYIYTNADDCVNFKLVRAPEAHPGKENWVEVIAHTQDVTITDVECFLNHLVVSFRQDGFTQVRVLTFANRLDSVDDATFATDCQLTSDFADLNFADPMYTVYPALNRRFACDYVRVLYTSMTRPTETIDVSVADVSDMKTLHCKEVPNYDKSLYNSERVWATSSVDNKTRIPCSAVFRGAERKPDSPMFLVGYGAYGYSYEPEFSSTILPLLDRGVVVVYAHIRGGAEMGEMWYQNGKFLNKKNTFSDFLDCAKHLIAENWTSPGHLVIQGASAGGLVMGNAINQAPELFAGVVCRAPFVDLIGSMSDEKLPLTVGEWKEWGNPNEEKYAEYMLSYCPYQNVSPGKHPAVYVQAGLNDNRVAFWEPLKWVARLRATNTGSNPIMLSMKVVGGHFGATGRYGWVKDKASEYCFVLSRMGLLEQKEK